MLQFCGGNALSSFRLEKLKEALTALKIQVSHISTEYWYFCAVRQTLTPEETAVLEKLLNSCPSQHHDAQSAFFLVIPRPGTISPWSSKATDIAHHCGLYNIERIERGIAYTIQAEQDLSEEQQQ